MRLQDLSNNAVHQVARFYAAAEATIHGHRAKIDGPRTLIKVNDKPAQVLGRRGNGAWQVDKNPPFDENAEVVIFADLGCTPPGFYIAPAPRDKRRHPRPPRRIQGPARRATSQKPHSNHSEIKLKDIQQWQDHWNAFN